MEILNKYLEFLQARNFSKVYYNYIKKWLDFCNKNKIDFMTISQENITQFFTENNYKTETKNLYIKSGRSFYDYLNIKDNEWKKIKLLKIEKRLPEYLTYEDIQKSIKYIYTYNERLNSKKLELILLLMFYTGIRKGELLFLKREDIYVDELEIKIYNKKSKEEKILDFPEILKEKFKDYFNSEPEEINAFNVTISQINYFYRIILSKFLGKKIRPHLTRHGNAVYLLNKGISLNVLQDELGHKDIKTTMKYLSVTRETRKKTYKEKIG